MSDIRDLPVMIKADAEAIGFAGFNDVPHKVIDLPDGDFTISAKTSDGRRVTFSFQPHSPDGTARFVDIQFHDRGTTIPSTNGEPRASATDDAALDRRAWAEAERRSPTQHPSDRFHSAALRGYAAHRRSGST